MQDMIAKFGNFLKKHIRTTTFTNQKHMKYDIAELKDLIACSIELFKSEPMLGEINPPCVIVGDIHGQYFDLLRMFLQFSEGPKHGSLMHKFVFLGDYVDRGRRSLECICLVLVLKLCFPKKFVILRGNHESETVNKTYGFYEELNERFDKDDAELLYKGFNEVFSWMPLAGLVGKKILCMHGGISPHLKTLDDIRKIPRPLPDPNPNPLAMDLLWADPMVGIKGYSKNTIRGVASFFGEDAVKECCETLGIDLIVRGHQMMQTGYGFFASRKCATIFSAPKYQGDSCNSGATLFVTDQGKIGFRVLKPRQDDPADAKNKEKRKINQCRKFSSGSTQNTQGSDPIAK